jgi:bis(5'-nucleosidyl)-tetraphosphatase
MSNQPRTPKRLFVAVPLEGLADTLVDGIAACRLSSSKKAARETLGFKKRKSGIVTVRVRDAEREGVSFRAIDGGWEPLVRLDPHLLRCDDDRALKRVRAHRKRSAGGLLVSSLEDPRVMLMYRVHGENTSWKTPKGGIDRGETRRDAAKREVAEEAGLTRVRIVDALGNMQYFKSEKGRLREKTVHLFLMLNEDGESSIAPREGERFVSAEWLAFDDAVARVTQKQARAVIRRGQRVLAKQSSAKK